LRRAVSTAWLFFFREISRPKKVNMKINLKTPISYYGGKQKLCSTIIELIPDHILYGEPYVGGGAVFFAKQPSEVEVLNDTNKELINFYSVTQNHFLDLEKMVRSTLHSRRQHTDASVIYNNPHLFNEIERAWAFWVLSSQSFSSMIDGTWGYDKKANNTSIKIDNKKAGFTELYAVRLQNVQLECADALYIIKSRDTKDSFFYCDPPYPNSNCGHYDGFSVQDFVALLDVLSSIKGRFLLSSYPLTELDSFVQKRKWFQRRIEQRISVNKGYSSRKKTEVLTANFQI
jgi:DNA adenine methylase